VVKDLVLCKALLIIKKEGQNWISFNKDYDKWVVSYRAPSALVGKKVVLQQTPKKEIIKKKDNKEEAGKQVLQKFAEVFSQTGFKSIAGFEKNMSFWLESYSIADILKAVALAKNHEYWGDKLTPVILFRRSNKAGPCDYIGDILSGEKKISVGHDEHGFWRDDNDGDGPGYISESEYKELKAKLKD
jgi:hypothetical protein